MLSLFLRLTVVVILTGCSISALAQEAFSAADLLSTRQVTSTSISPDGKWIAYTLSITRDVNDKPGRAYSELHLINTRTGASRPFVTGEVRATGVSWRPDGGALAFLSRRGPKAKTQVWAIPADGGEASQLTDAASSVLAFKWHPSGKKIGYIAVEVPSAREAALKEKGFGFVYYEENLRHRNLYMLDVASGKADQLTNGVSVWKIVFSPDGKKIAAGVSPRNLIDHSYVFQKIHLLDIASKSLDLLAANPGKLGNFVFSPDGKNLAYAAALTKHDNAVSQAFVVNVANGKITNLTPPQFRGHVNWVGWKDNATMLYRAGEGVEMTLCAQKISGGQRKVMMNSANDDVIFSAPSTAGNGSMAVVGQMPTHPGEVYFSDRGKALKRLTHSNPSFKDRQFGNQVSVRYTASDGVEVGGLLIYPVGFQKGSSYPLVVLVHGGPESHYSDGWLSRYSTPGMVLASEGFLVFYPNYRSSTGLGVEYSAVGFGDAAGREFDDIADGIDHLIASGLADKDRVGLGGGSYGGYASAWFSSYYTEKVKAVCMFVGISDLISKRSTTDIPYEELYVHSGKKLEEMWQQSLERSPVYHAHKSKTAVLIYGGTADTRVHPSQSLEYYRRLKMNDHPAVRLVQYPGEPHGNRKQAGQMDVLYRIMDWYTWYVKDARPLDGEMPPLDLSNKYGISLPN